MSSLFCRHRQTEQRTAVSSGGADQAVGMTPEEARDTALRSFGNRTVVREEARGLLELELAGTIPAGRSLRRAEPLCVSLVHRDSRPGHRAGNRRDSYRFLPS